MARMLQKSSCAGAAAQKAAPAAVTWMSLPRKSQLLVLCLCRVFDFLQIAALQAYMFYLLKSFDENLSDAEISTQAGILQGVFSAAQFATAIPWGRVADSRWGGRKFVLIIGLMGTAISCLGMAFSTTFYQAVFWRLFGGGINGTVGIIRTMIAENVKEKKYHSRAFLILPLGFNIAALFGPVIGGLLSDVIKSYPALFRVNSILGGNVRWLRKYPYSLPMLLNFIFITFCTILVTFFLEETLEARKVEPGIAILTFRFLRRCARKLLSLIFKSTDTHRQTNGELFSNAMSERAESSEYLLERSHEKKGNVSQILPFKRIWTSNVIFTLLAQAIFDFQMGAFNNLWLLFLSTARHDPRDPINRRNLRILPFVFGGGLGMLPQSVGLATSTLGVIGMILQFTIYPKLNSKLGTARSYQYFLVVFPLAYFLVPFVSLAPSSTMPPAPASGVWVWVSIIIVLFLQVTARTFTLPTSIILMNNCSPHPSVLGTVHGLGQAVSSAARTIGPVFSGDWYGYGFDIGMVGFSWWMIAIISAAGSIFAMFIYEGSGHEIYMPGEAEEES